MASKRSYGRRNTLAILAFVVAFFWAAASAEGTHKPVPLVICDVFGKRHCADALRVSWCESRWTTTARNGQYLGIFQMGSWERRTFGHGSTAEAQARGAYRYFVRTGRTWRPWSCKPDGSVR